MKSKLIPAVANSMVLLAILGLSSITLRAHNIPTVTQYHINTIFDADVSGTLDVVTIEDSQRIVYAVREYDDQIKTAQRSEVGVDGEKIALIAGNSEYHELLKPELRDIAFARVRGNSILEWID